MIALAGDALAVEDLELGLLERRRDLVLDHLDPGLVADDLLAFLDRADAADVQAHRGVELERVAAGGGLRAAEHHADLHADLVDEDHQQLERLMLPVSLRSAWDIRRACRPTCMSPISPSISALGQRRHRVDHHHIDRIRSAPACR
jgi:hypothetical protein